MHGTRKQGRVYGRAALMGIIQSIAMLANQDIHNASNPTVIAHWHEQVKRN